MGCDPSRYIPPFFVVTLASVLCFTIIFKIYPDIYFHSKHTSVTLFFWILVTLCFIMFMWSWLYASFSDPGRLEDDLKAKGVLNQILQGDLKELLHQEIVNLHIKVTHLKHSLQAQFKALQLNLIHKHH